jgi:hypothetical protein
LGRGRAGGLEEDLRVEGALARRGWVEGDHDGGADEEAGREGGDEELGRVHRPRMGLTDMNG